MIPASFTWDKDGITYTVKGFYAPSEVQTRRDPGEPSFFDFKEIDPPRNVSDEDEEDMRIRADEVYAANTQMFFESLMQ